MNPQPPRGTGAPMDRRRFLTLAGSRGAALGVVGVGLPTLLAACGDDDSDNPVLEGGDDTTATSVEEATGEAQPVVGDVVDFALASDEWPGDFGFVTLAIHAGAVDGNDVYYVCTDASDQDYANAEQLVFVPKIASLTGDGLSGAAYVVENGAADQSTVFSTEPGRPDYTPAWTLHRVTWSGEAQPLRSEQEIRDGESEGSLTVERTNIVINSGIVKWSNGEMAVDKELMETLGSGQLIEPVDTEAMEAKFKLHQCYPGNRYMVLDHSMDAMADGTSTVYSPRLGQGPTAAGATGRTNVFLNGIEGPGPMGFQPSAFDFDAGDAAWSPFWDHFAYQWKEGVEPRVLESQEAVHEAREDRKSVV